MDVWTDVASGRLRNAQERLGLTNHQVAAQLNLSEKQWRRWRDENKVRTIAIPRVEQVLQIEIPRNPLPAAPVKGPLAELEAAVVETSQRQRLILIRLDGIDEVLDAVLSQLQRIEQHAAPPPDSTDRREADMPTGSPP